LSDAIKQYDVWRVSLEPVVGSEMAKSRPCVVVSRNEVNAAVRTVVVVPLTSTRRKWPFRPQTNFRGIMGDVAIEHIRAVDKSRLVRRLGRVDAAEALLIADFLAAFFTASND
jgi:mRNA interferase MazF